MSITKSFTHHRIICLIGIFCLGLVAVYFVPGIAISSVSAQMTAIESISSGNWSDPKVWSEGVVPQVGDDVTIRAGDTIVYDVVSDAVLDQVTINGVLYFSRQTNTRLRVGNHILVQAGGYLNMGTPTDYLPPNIKAELDFVLTEAQANAFVGASPPVAAASNSHDGVHDHSAASVFDSPDIGLWVFEQGRWDVYGAPLLRTWSKLASNASVGAQTVVVENNVGDWYVGGQIVLTSTRNPQQYSIRPQDGREISKTFIEHEIRTIQALEVLANGQTKITLNQPLTFAHAGVAPYRGEVALLTRNVLVSTELVGVNEAAYTDVRTRKFAHTMFMPGAKGNIEYSEFKRMGHYGKLGRYTIHHHRMLETSKGMVVRGNAMWETGFRCVNLHISHGVLVEDNVCYDSSSTAFFVEEDERKANEPQGYQRGYNQDNVFVHNIAIATNPKHFEDRLDISIAGEVRRAGAFWPGAETQNEAYLGNVAVGGKEFGDSAGFSFPEISNALNNQGEIPFTFVHNEVHSSASHGIFSWQNVPTRRDMVDSLLWRNGDAGIKWGAYNMPLFYFNTQLLQNGKSALDITAVSPFLQDSTIVGSLADGSSVDVGFAINGYITPQYPNPGSWLVRNRFQDLKTTGVSQLQKTVANDNVSGTECKTHDFALNQPFDLKQRPVHPGECSAVYITMMGNQFVNVPRPLAFGQAPNPNSWWKVFDHNGGIKPADDFVLVRADQKQTTKQGVITKKLVTTQAKLNTNFNAMVVPMSSLPAGGIQFTGLLNHRTAQDQKRSASPDFTFTTQADYPPVVTLNVTLNGESVKIKANATDDRSLTRIEFFVDWVKVATYTPSKATKAASNEITLNLAGHPRKYAYLYVRAFDGTRQLGDYEQRAYSNVVEIGPEILGRPELSASTTKILVASENPVEEPSTSENPLEDPFAFEVPTDPGYTSDPGTPIDPDDPSGSGYVSEPEYIYDPEYISGLDNVRDNIFMPSIISGAIP
jgi:hypothetical protein